MNLIKTASDAIRESSLARSIVNDVKYVRDVLIDFILNIDTAERKKNNYPEGSFEDLHPYESVDYILLRKFIGELDLKKDDIVVDIGCGKGRILGLVGRNSVKKVIGIEISSELFKKATENSRNLRGKNSEIEVINRDARKFDFDTCNKIIMFNPFGKEIMQSVIENLRLSLKKHPRDIKILYINPAYQAVLEKSGFLEKTKDVSSMIYKTTASIWKNIA